MISRKQKARKALHVLTWIAIPLLTVASVASAIYYVVKNTRSIEKEFWSVERFNNEVKKIRLNDTYVGSLEANKLYEDFNNEKAKANKLREDYINKHSEVKDYLDSSKLVASLGIKPRINKLLKNIPPHFDADAFLRSKIKSLLNFEQTKYLDFKFSNIEKINNDPSSLKIYYEIFLNYQYARGIFETNKIKQTASSKYYFTSSQVAKFFSNDYKIFQGSSFYNNWAKNKLDAEKIIKEINNKSKEFDDKIKELEEKKHSVNDEAKKEEIDKEINELKKRKDVILKNPDFQNKVFKWFEKVFNETDAYSDVYPGKEYKLAPYKFENTEEPYVIWNPRKGLNELTIKFKFIHQKNSKIESYPQIIIFTLDEV